MQSGTARLGRERSGLDPAARLDRRGSGDLSVRASFLPLGHRNGKFEGLVRVRVDATESELGELDLGAVLLGSEGVVERWSRRVSVQGARLPVILELRAHTGSGEKELVAVAREVSSGRIGADSAALVLPTLESRGLAILPTAILQPLQAVFSREKAEVDTGFAV